MAKNHALFEVLAALSAGATLLAACGDAPPPPAVAPAGATEVPHATAPAAPAMPAAAVPAAPAAPAAAMPAAAAPAVPAAPGKPKVMPPKIHNSKRVVDKSAAACCGVGTCAPC